MRVKRLEIQGFKSFKDKTVIHFDHSITGIVGPNGCGKSNIVDAFFWVMGEQSYKHMRGSSSEDLIFNGSSKYSPLGLAEATMVLESYAENPEGPAGATSQDLPPQLKTKEISVTRRLYRSGEGEYFINGTLARLKDIQELFMDTGVGAKGYSVIEQGQIGKIVNSKPDERRLLIEDAAGIAKYKARKKESLRKMEATQANLSRLTDIIQEIEKSLDSLERQAQKARHYKKYKDELFDKEITWGRRKFRLLQQKLENLKTSRDTLEQELAAVRAETQTMENSIEVERVSLLTETKAAEELQTEIQGMADRLSQEKSALDLSRRRQGDLAQQLASLQSEKEELEEAIQNGKIRLTEAEAQAESATSKVQDAASHSQLLQDEVSGHRSEIAKARALLESQQRELKKVVSDLSTFASKAASLEARAQSAEAQKERIHEQIEIQTEKGSSIASELAENKERSASLATRKSDLQESKKDLASKKETQAKQLREMEQTLSSAEKKVTQLCSKLASLQELDASYEGLAEGPKTVLEWAKANGKRDQIHALTDAIQVEPGYEVVFQSWLEDQVEHLLTGDLTLAIEQLDSTATGKRGRVAFQIAQHGTTFQEPKKASLAKVTEVLSKSGFEVCGELTQFLKILPEKGRGLERLLDSVCVVKSSAPLQGFLEKSGSVSDLEGWNIVSLDGVVFESTGVLRGGSLDASGSLLLLRRKQQIEALKTESDAAEAERIQAQSACDQAEDDLAQAQAKMDALQAELQVLEIEVASVNRDIHQTERAVSESNSHLQGLNRDLERVTRESEQAHSEKEDLQTQIQELTALRISEEENVQNAQNQLAAKESGLREQEEALNNVKISEASVLEQSRSLKREVQSLQSLVSDQTRRLQEIIKTLARANLEHTEFSGSESGLAQAIEDLTRNLSAARLQLSEIKNGIEQRNARVAAAMDRMKVLHKSAERQANDSTQFALDSERLSGELSHIILNLEEKYGAGCLQNQNAPAEQVEMEDGISTPQVTWEEISEEEERLLGEEVERLRERIRRLGEVNVMAIEEFETLKKRYDYLISERLDLNRSLGNLQEAIDHINKTSEERFRKAFEAIADRFERLFPIIFGGGSAKLSLIYPEGSEDILEAGVDILAQPPGKKVANITLLSGGEKALTAVSLIFAIFMVKPSPFCVLDEVDAPLDDANIGKFNALLKEMSAKSQFILITHNKKTMELNDTLYGVTMEEPGVSKMVSIEMH